jgi:hypothetical protein
MPTQHRRNSLTKMLPIGHGLVRFYAERGEKEAGELEFEPSGLSVLK